MIPAEALPNPVDLAEAQLQEELRAMFAVDTQQYIDSYFNIVASLNEPAWVAQIQELYRCIHTIKGGAVTVGAEAVLQVSIVLEDLLSDLRCLQTAPELGDGVLIEVLQESGELLTASLELTDADIATRVAPTVERLQVLHQQIKLSYLPEWNENQQLFQEFADQGFDLVVLDLEIAVESLPSSGNIPRSTIKAAQTTLDQLTQIGQDLEMGEGWQQLLGLGQCWLTHNDLPMWQQFWPPFLPALKANARKGGQVTEAATAFLETYACEANPLAQLDGNLYISDISADAAVEDAGDFGAFLSDQTFGLEFADSDFASVDFADSGLLDSLLADFPLDAFVDAPSIAPEPVALEPMAFETIDAAELTGDNAPAALTESMFADLAFVESEDAAFLDSDADLEPAFEVELGADIAPVTESALSNLEIPAVVAEGTSDFTGIPADLNLEPELDRNWFVENLPTAVPDGATAPEAEALDWVIDQPAEPAPEAPKPAAKAVDLGKVVQIPVPLERLDRSAQHLIATLMSSRTTQGVTQKLQDQLGRIHNLSQSSIDFVAELRKLQDNYALLNDNSNDQGNGIALERYRQGYLIINRLLETNLRLSELGAEAAVSAQTTQTSLNTLERNLLSLQQTIEESRLVLFKTLAMRARAIVRDLTTRVGKPAQLVVYGEQFELDANTSQGLEPVLLHLLRNAYDHGLETAKHRLANHKPEQGTLKLSLQRRGSTYLLELKDDGGGMDPDKIAHIAYAKGLPLSDTGTSAKLLEVICQPGFSSQKEVSDISGRGVGMDVVASQVAALGGKLSLETKLGQGTTFRIQLPVPQLLVRCVMVRAGNLTFAIPADDIITTTLALSLTANPVPKQVTGATWAITEDATAERVIPGLDLWEYWSAQGGAPTLSDTAIALRIESRAANEGRPDTAWLLADDLLEQSDLLITPLPDPLQAPQGLMGVSLQADGKFIPVLDAVTLAEYLAHPERLSTATAVDDIFASQNPAVPMAAKQTFTGESTILVVDDAALVRRRIEASLSSAGYVVHTCVDGLEAWNWLQSHTIPSMVITDIEMPNMDGFTLISRCRQVGMDMPMLVVSSRVSDEWGREARRLGASDYLTKGFTTPELLEKVSSIIQQSAKERILV
jgi:chemotaxis protein histidine kinase CheA/CheY-like chemotaxis protein